MPFDFRQKYTRNIRSEVRIVIILIIDGEPRELSIGTTLCIRAITLSSVIDIKIVTINTENRRRR